MPKTVQKPTSPRRDCSEMPVGRVAVPKTGKSIGTLPFLDRSAGRSPREDGPEVLVGKVAVPKTGQMPPFAMRGCLWSTYGRGSRA